METLSLQDTHSLHRSIQKIYALQNSPTFELDALTIIDQLVPSEVPSAFSTNFQTQQVQLIFQPSFPGLSPETQQVIQARFGEHPLVQNMPRTLDGAHKISDFLRPAAFHRLEGLYQQYLRLYDIEDQITFFLPDASSGGLAAGALPPTDVLGFSLNRPQRSFTERDRLMLNFLRPHLAQAYANAQQYQVIQQNFSQLQQSCNVLGLVILDTELRIQSIAPQAAIWLDTYFTRSAAPLPDHLQSWIKHQIAHFSIPAELPKAIPPLRVEIADRQLTLRLIIEPQSARYLLLLEEQPIGQSLALAILGLSPREAELLNGLIQGKNNQALAEQMGITTATVRKHLENLYRKLDASSRAEAIAAAIAKLGVLNTLPLC
jgi:DNA-binding CsgD family transcriptional regulator